MTQTIQRIQLPLPFRLGTVNCYLIGTGEAFILIDTGCAQNRAALEAELATAGCTPENLNLILLTHGDFDHTGNAAYLKQKFGAQLSMHPKDAACLEQGDMFINRSSANFIIRFVTPILFKFKKSDRVSPDFVIGEGVNLSHFGWDASVLSLPGHSPGSISLLTPEGDLFCGDLLDNMKQPMLNTLNEDPAAARASFERVLPLPIRTIYPGHGNPFSLDELKTA